MSFHEKDPNVEDAVSDQSLEKGYPADTARPGFQPAIADPSFKFEASELDRVQRRLKQRHVQMIAIAGTLGTGLFLGSGESLAKAGPLGALIAYALVGSVAYSSLCSVGEMTAHAPVSGTFPHFASRWVDPAFGFAVGWNYFYANAVSIPVEISAATVLVTYWDSDTNHQWIYTLVVGLFVCLVNVFGVRWFGETEFGFSLIKITLITGLILVGLIIDLGGGPNHERIGFRYWDNPGAINRAGLVSNINTDRFLALLSVLVQAAFSYQGMELVAIAASETESPRRNISRAVRRVFYRIVIFYMLGTLITGMLVPYNDPDLAQSTGTAAESPYVIAMTRAGITVLPSIINAAIFTSAFSAGSSFMFCASRILYGLALRGQAPKIFTRCTNKGLPIVAVATCSCFAFLAFMNVSAGAVTVFNWFVNLSTTAGFFGWLSINLTFLFFYRGMKYQGFDRKKSAYYSSLQPYLSIWGVFWCTFFILVNGFEVFFVWDVQTFFTDYINIPIFFGFFIFWKLYKRTRMWRPHEMDFVTGVPSYEETETPEIPPRNVWEKIAAVLF